MPVVGFTEDTAENPSKHTTRARRKAVNATAGLMASSYAIPPSAG